MLQIILTSEQARVVDEGRDEDRQALLLELRARAARLSARNGYISVFYDYEEVELLHPDGRVLETVEADPWAVEQRELAKRIRTLADEEDVVPREAAAALVRAEYGEAHPDWHKTQHGTALAERMGCWQAYASLWGD